MQMKYTEAERLKRVKSLRARRQAKAHGMDYCSMCEQEKPFSEMRSGGSRCKKCAAVVMMEVRKHALSLTPKQKKILVTVKQYPSWSQCRVAQHCNASQSLVSIVLRRVKVTARWKG